MAMIGALKNAILGHIRIPVSQTAISVAGSNKLQSFPNLISRAFSSHDDHLTKDEVTQRVLAVIKDFPKVDPSKVTPDVHFQNDLGLDSLDNVELVMALEEEFKLEIPDLEADKLDSTKLAIEYIHNHPMAS
ncbi:acyl carrier protein 1, mitochondrial-like [Chenopodium quinoa]|uniref:Acyl carrier protein n=1 Tax=Chenopodium quinoa TaxID=63459 RepID=A0A803LIJ3_CHEQI|nr:acyl carrier protein 1, mitochondrial-like [Chenopodium quinoa]